jgi:hypothetical protein
MNNQSSPNKIIISIAVLAVALVGVYFSMNKAPKIAPENMIQTGTSTTSTSSVGKPTITKLDLPSGPLNVDQEGTWTVFASSTDGKALTYSVVWGDEVVTDPTVAVNPVKIGTSTFSHAYSYPGVYTPTITIYGSDGQSVYASVGQRILGETKKAPIIYSLAPSSAEAGTLVTINGGGFTAPKPIPNGPGNMPSNEVLFDGVGLAGVTANGVNNLYFLIPSDAKVGKHTVQVKNSNGSSNVVKVVVK